MKICHQNGTHWCHGTGRRTRTLICGRYGEGNNILGTDIDIDVLELYVCYLCYCNMFLKWPLKTVHTKRNTIASFLNLTGQLVCCSFPGSSSHGLIISVSFTKKKQGMFPNSVPLKYLYIFPHVCPFLFIFHGSVIDVDPIFGKLQQLWRKSFHPGRTPWWVLASCMPDWCSSQWRCQQL